MKSNTQDCFLSELMTSANMGWWEADVNSESYICSEYILKSATIIQYTIKGRFMSR